MTSFLIRFYSRVFSRQCLCLFSADKFVFWFWSLYIYIYIQTTANEIKYRYWRIHVVRTLQTPDSNFFSCLKRVGLSLHDTFSNGIWSYLQTFLTYHFKFYIFFVSVSEYWTLFRIYGHIQDYFDLYERRSKNAIPHPKRKAITEKKKCYNIQPFLLKFELLI